MGLSALQLMAGPGTERPGLAVPAGPLQTWKYNSKAALGSYPMASQVHRHLRA